MEQFTRCSIYCLYMSVIILLTVGIATVTHNRSINKSIAKLQMKGR